jgi:hypothetical protein
MIGRSPTDREAQLWTSPVCRVPRDPSGVPKSLPAHHLAQTSRFPGHAPLLPFSIFQTPLQIATLLLAIANLPGKYSFVHPCFDKPIFADTFNLKSVLMALDVTQRFIRTRTPQNNRDKPS